MTASVLIDVHQLRVGLHVQLELGWMDHPFPLSSFKLSTEDQLVTLRTLGLRQVRVLPGRSDTDALRALVAAGVLGANDAGLPDVPSATVGAAPAVPAETPEAAERRKRREALEVEQACLHLAERLYLEAGRTLKRSFDRVAAAPQETRLSCEGQVQAFLDHMLGEQEVAIRLLSEGAGDRASAHALNVAVVSLLLGKALGLAKPDMFDLGVGALLHDVGKLDLPERVRWLDPLASQTSTHERTFYQEHVAHGVTAGKRMGLSAGALLVVAQHHELADGTGFPLRLAPERQSQMARIVALVNRYDNLCNPASPALALTPHEALSLMFAQMKAKFDSTVFAAFIKMMGVYPPGSVVQLTDDRYALVLAVNASRPLKPRVLVHDPKRRRDEALPLDLETEPLLGIRRSLKPQHLPRATLDYLSPRPRICYFFERARDMVTLPGTLA